MTEEEAVRACMRMRAVDVAHGCTCEPRMTCEEEHPGVISVSSLHEPGCALTIAAQARLN